MTKKRIGALTLAALALTPTLLFTAGCSGEETIVLRVFNWERIHR